MSEVLVSKKPEWMRISVRSWVLKKVHRTTKSFNTCPLLQANAEILSNSGLEAAASICRNLKLRVEPGRAGFVAYCQERALPRCGELNIRIDKGKNTPKGGLDLTKFHRWL